MWRHDVLPATSVTVIRPWPLVVIGLNCGFIFDLGALQDCARWVLDHTFDDSLSGLTECVRRRQKANQQDRTQPKFARWLSLPSRHKTGA